MTLPRSIFAVHGRDPGPWRRRRARNARRLFMTSNLYLVAAMILLVLG
jgi:heme O synthase-like polyprenyltransferase